MNAYERKKLEKRLRRKTGEAIVDYNMIEDGDRVMVCLSGGKDSYTMLDMLIHLKRAAPISFSIVVVNLDQKQPGFPAHVLPEYLDSLGVEYHIETQDTYSIVMDKIPEGRTLCSLCSRLRRGILYRVAEELGTTKIALGHHMDDMVETLFLNMFHGSRMKSMPPKLISDNKNNIVIRPLAYCREKDIARYSAIQEYPIIPCNLCGSQDNLERVKIKFMLREWEKENPNRVVSIFKSMTRVSRSHLFDKALYDFEGLTVGQADLPEELDTAFDRESVKQTAG
ncbi:MAG: tRNA 2-thiocytidine(32) synthetase TtcA [Gammaproteobacteria bacterium]